MARLTKDEILAHRFQFREEEVELEPLGGSILLRQISAGKQSRMLNGLIDGKTGEVKDFRLFSARQFAAACVDPKFSEREAVQLMEQMSAEDWKTIADAVGELNPAPEQAQEDAEEAFPGSDE